MSLPFTEQVAPHHVAVVIPAWNAAATIGAALESVAAQTRPPREVIVVDDGSTDDTAAIAARAGVTVLRVPNGGAARARNLGIAAATSPWIAFLDADDTWVPDKLERQAALFDRYSLSYTDARIDLDGASVTVSSVAPCPSGLILESLLLNNVITTSSVVVRRDVILDAGGFPEEQRAVHDWPLWLRIAAWHPIGFVDAPLVHYRISPDSLSRDLARTLPGHLDVLEEAFSRRGVAWKLRHLKRRAMAGAYRVVGYEAGRSSQWRLAATLFASALVQTPADFGAWKSLVKVPLAATGVVRW